MHAPGISADAEIEGKATVYADGDKHGREVSSSPFRAGRGMADAHLR
jgi:hypothetical protein